MKSFERGSVTTERGKNVVNFLCSSTTINTWGRTGFRRFRLKGRQHAGIPSTPLNGGHLTNWQYQLRIGGLNRVACL